MDNQKVEQPVWYRNKVNQLNRKLLKLEAAKLKEKRDFNSKLAKLEDSIKWLQAKSKSEVAESNLLKTKVKHLTRQIKKFEIEKQAQDEILKKQIGEAQDAKVKADEYSKSIKADLEKTNNELATNKHTNLQLQIALTQVQTITKEVSERVRNVNEANEKESVILEASDVQLFDKPVSQISEAQETTVISTKKIRKEVHKLRLSN